MYLSHDENKIRELFFNLRTRKDLCELLEISDSQLRMILYGIPDEKKYTKFYIPKKDKSVRVIHSPIDVLKFVQRKLNVVLNTVAELPVSAHGFRKYHNIKTNAEIHKDNDYILNIDLADFFPTIKFWRIQGLFTKYFNFSKRLSTILAQICCHEKHLPQGAPTSPILSNLICWKLDKQLQYIANRFGCKYSRYADDITFSSKKQFDTKICKYIRSKKIVKLGKIIRETIENNDFVINPRKIRFSDKSMRQEVTGIIINEKLNVSRKFFDTVRGAINAIKNYGYDKANEVFKAKIYKKHIHPRKQIPELSEVLLGKLEFVRFVKSDYDPRYRKLRRKLHDIEPCLIDLPIPYCNEGVELWFEGKTDVTHIKTAMEKLDYKLNNNLNDFKVFDGASKLRQHLVSIDKSNKKLIIGIFDYDKQGIAELGINRTNPKKQNFKKINRYFYQSKSNIRVFAIMLPTKKKIFKTYENFPVEFCYSKRTLNKHRLLVKRDLTEINKITSRLSPKQKLTQQTLNALNDLWYFKPVENKKVMFANLAKSFDESEFKHFNKLFNIFDKIIGYYSEFIEFQK